MVCAAVESRNVQRLARMMSKSVVVLLYSEELGWAGLKRGLARLPEVGEVHSAHCLEQAERLCSQASPDLFMTEPEPGGEPVTPLIKALRIDTSPACQIYLIDHQYDDDVLASLIRAGIDGVLLWADLAHGNAEVILRLLLAKRFRLTSQAVSRFSISLLAGPADRVPRLPERQMRLLNLKYRNGSLTYKQIAEILCVSESTVRREMDAIYAEFDAENLLQVGVHAGRQGVLS